MALLLALVSLSSVRSVASTSEALRTRLISGYARAGSSGWSSDERAEIDALINTLAGARTSFDKRALGGGLWPVAYTSGEAPRWQRDGPGNVAGQLYDLKQGRVINYAESLGGRVRLVASGELCEAEPTSTSYPKDFNVVITSASIRLGALPRVTLPIRGPATARLLYGDEGVRIFVAPGESPGRWESAGLVVCHVPAAALLGEAWTAPAELSSAGLDSDER